MGELLQVFGERRYDFAARKTRRLCLYGNGSYNLAIAQTNLHDFEQIMRQFSLSWFCHQGTLLGAAREGALISHDTDIDVALIDFDEVLLTQALQRLETEGFSVVRSIRGSRGSIDFVTIMRSDEYIDIHLFSRISRFGVKMVANKGFYNKEILFDSFTELSLAGLTVLAPRGYEALLGSWYGPDWKVPRFPRGTDNSGRASKFIALQRIFVELTRRILRRSPR